MKIAIIGAGISGLGCAYALSKESNFEIDLYEGQRHIGGHSYTIDLTLEDVTQGIDTGFLVFNHRTYPRLVKLFNELEVPVSNSEMTFSVSIPRKNEAPLEWSGTNLNTLFAQRENLYNPKFLKMVFDILRFNKQCTQLAESGALNQLNDSVADFLSKNRYSQYFKDWYFLPMIGAIWSCPVEQMLEFPMSTMIRFCHNHGLIQVNDRPQWMTVNGGSREYVKRIVAKLNASGVQIIKDQVTTVRRGKSIEVLTENNSLKHYDHVIFASHSDQTLNMLGDAHPDEAKILGAVRYQKNRAVVHTDRSLLPQNENCWSAWNYTTNNRATLADRRVCVNYLINKLQPLPAAWKDQAVVVSLNPVKEPQARLKRMEIEYEHPIFDAKAIEAQQQLSLIQGVRNTWFCGAWTGYGFHEDGLRSGELVAQALTKLHSTETDTSSEVFEAA